jgi:uncharacterized protein involved in exopolysaccharide biosynthesis
MPHAPAQADVVSVKELASILWRSKVFIVVMTLLVGAAAVAGGLLIPKKYEGSVLLSPVTEESGGNGRLGAVSALMSQFGFAGLGGGAGGAKRAESLALLQSQALTEQYIQDNNLLPVLFAKKWDAQAGRWNVTDPDKIPDLWDGNRAFGKIRQVADDAKTGLVKLSITWTDPKTAAKWANDLVKLTNEQSRARALSEAQRNIAYLNEQAAKTTESELRQAIYQLLEVEMKQEMLARGNYQYALRVIDPAKVPRRPTTPGVLVWALAGLAGGIFLSMLLALLRAAWNVSATSREDPAIVGAVQVKG